jgi:hypothetical protein
MNDRIQELINHARLIPWQQEELNPIDPVTLPIKMKDYIKSIEDQVLEKFAELIIRDCLGICKSIENIDGMAFECYDNIKQHFRVEK